MPQSRSQVNTPDRPSDLGRGLSHGVRQIGFFYEMLSQYRGENEAEQHAADGDDQQLCKVQIGGRVEHVDARDSEREAASDHRAGGHRRVRDVYLIVVRVAEGF